MPPVASNAESAPRVGALLRYWRQQRGRSQLDLSLEAGFSQRHISFVESGRSLPSRELLMALSQAMNIPLRERNTLLLAAGYAPVYQERAVDAPEMALLKAAIDRVLRQQEPHPALVLDRYWNVIRTNNAAPGFFGRFVDLAQRKAPRNLLHLMFDPDGLRPFIDDWTTVAAGLLERVRREAIGQITDAKTSALLKELSQYPGVPNLEILREQQSPVLPITFVKDGQRWSYFSLITTVGTPQCITAQELRIECMYPVQPGSQT